MCLTILGRYALSPIVFLLNFIPSFRFLLIRFKAARFSEATRERYLIKIMLFLLVDFTSIKIKTKYNIGKLAKSPKKTFL